MSYLRKTIQRRLTKGAVYEKAIVVLEPSVSQSSTVSQLHEASTHETRRLCFGLFAYTFPARRISTYQLKLRPQPAGRQVQ